jgi:hypothetical protein
MDVPVVDALLDAFGPFVIPTVVFAAGAVGYGLLFLAGRMLGADGSRPWGTEDREDRGDAPDPDRRDG